MNNPVAPSPLSSASTYFSKLQAVGSWNRILPRYFMQVPSLVDPGHSERQEVKSQVSWKLPSLPEFTSPIPGNWSLDQNAF